MTDILRLFGPLVLWLASFSAVYGLHGIVCAAGLADGPGAEGMTTGRALLMAAWGFAVAAQVLALWVVGSARFGAAPGFARWTSLTLAVTALAAAVWTLFPVAVMSVCD